MSTAGHRLFPAVMFSRGSGRQNAVTTTEDRYRVQSVERAFVLLEALAEAGPEGMILSDLARLLGVSKSSAYAILQTLLAGGFVADWAGRRNARTVLVPSTGTVAPNGRK